MAASPLTALDASESGHHTYSRKQKSLGLLCSNFLSVYNRDGVECIGLDDAASKLGVERRRIYDIVNVLESVGMLARKAKNQYNWKGFNGIPKALAALKEEGFKENFGSDGGTGKMKFQVFGCDEDSNSNPDNESQPEAPSNSTSWKPDSNSNHDTGSQSEAPSSNTSSNPDSNSNPHNGSQPEAPSNNTSSKPVFDFDENSNSNPDNGSQPDAPSNNTSSKPKRRREKSLGLLTKNFVKLFICSNLDLISLDEAAKILLGDSNKSTVMRTKVRRLYDIANVLSSMQLIEKTNQTVSKKPAFRWLGLRGKADTHSQCSIPMSTGTQKRAFGTDVTNISFRLKRGDFASGKEPKKLKMQKKTENVESEQNTRPRSYQFGPFIPVTVAKAGVTDHKNPKRIHNLECHASTFRPQYHNQALRDLFDHYMEAWKSWYSEVAGMAVVGVTNQGKL